MCGAKAGRWPSPPGPTAEGRSVRPAHPSTSTAARSRPTSSPCWVSRCCGGCTFQPDEDRPGAAPVAIISDRLWQERYNGDPGVVGRPLAYDGRSYTVVGVAPARFQLESPADVYTPLGQSPDLPMQNRAARFIHTVARIRSGDTIGQARSELSVIASGLATAYPRSNAGVDMGAEPLQQELVGEVAPTLWLLLAAVGVVLLLACVNVASLLLARAVSREREFAMRAALGATRGRLVRQCLAESAVLGAAGGLLGALVAAASVRPFVAAWPGSLPRAMDVHFSASAWLFACALSLASSILFGLAPVARVRMHGVERAIRTGGRGIAGSSSRLQRVCVVSELALAVVLLVSAGMLGRTILTLASTDLGIDTHDVLTARVALSPATLSKTSDLRSAWQDVLDRARGVPGVKAAALADIIPMREGDNILPYWTKPSLPPVNDMPVARASAVTPDYPAVMGIPVRAGRFLDDHDRIGSQPVVVIDERLARDAFGSSNPVGRQLWVPALGSTPVLIVGIVGHVRNEGPAGDTSSRVRGEIYYPFAQVPASLLRLFSTFMSVAVRTHVAPATLEQPLRQALRGATGDQTLYRVRTMEQLAAGSLDRQRFLLLLFAVFAGIALLLASVGVYGLLSYLTKLRVPEFASGWRWAPRQAA